MNAHRDGWKITKNNMRILKKYDMYRLYIVLTLSHCFFSYKYKYLLTIITEIEIQILKKKNANTVK